jgi:hypothetical protein
MTRPDRGNAAVSWPFDQMMTLLLRQVKRPIAAFGIELSDAEADSIARQIANHSRLDDKALAVRAALVKVVGESEALLKNRWELTFEQSVDTNMDSIPGWESTADFLDIANEKINAELRISVGAALVTALGDRRYARHLIFQSGRDEQDVDTVIARRVLAFASGLEFGAPEWAAQIELWASAPDDPS